MCGIYGSTAGDPDRLLAIARAAAMRGPHAHGYAVADSDLTRTVRLGPFTSSSGEDLRGHAGAPLIGHSRLATTRPRSQRTLDDAQPLICDELAVAHNGIVPLELQERYAWLEPRTGNDSELIGLLVARLVREMSREDAVTQAVEELTAGHPYALLVLWGDGQIIGCSRRLPLWGWWSQESAYLCSRPAFGDRSEWIRIEDTRKAPQPGG